MARPHIINGRRANENESNVERNVLREKDVGITEYVSSNEGFCGIIKQRFSDFHVNEIDRDGNVVTLCTTVPPDVPAVPTNQRDEAEEYLHYFLSKEILEKLKHNTYENESEGIEVEVTLMSKEERRKLHHAIQVLGHGKLVSNTQEKDGKKFIIISKHKQGAKNDVRNCRWPAERGGDYVHFVLYKENMDTMETVNLIASKLRIRSNMIGYAGTKDRRGKTSQLMCVWHIEPRTLASVGSSIRGITLGNYVFKKECLKLGDLHGNRFRIALRNVTGSDEEVEEAMCSLTEKGFLNYYGLQRFGCSAAVPTYEIGRVLLKGEWKPAVELILKPRDDEQNLDLKEARRIWWETRDASKAFKVLRNRDKLLEGKLLLGLSQHNTNDYVNALEKIPRNTRLLYLHSYQSLVWNKVVSRRIQQFGLKPLEGDLVLVENTKMPEEQSARGVEDSSSRKLQVRVLTALDLSTVTIEDIVLPLPGHDVMYPQNIMQEWYEELLALDGLSSAKLKQNNVRKYSVGGAYRRVLIRPSNVSWKTIRYSDPQKTLILSDLEVLKGAQAPSVEPDGLYKALLVDFQLPSSAYATMALREILKADTSSQHQASLNRYHCSKEREHMNTRKTCKMPDVCQIDRLKEEAEANAADPCDGEELKGRAEVLKRSSQQVLQLHIEEKKAKFIN